MEIRKAKLSDVNSILKLFLDFVKEHNNTVISKSPEKKKRRELINNFKEISRDNIKKMIRSKNNSIFLAFENENIIGFNFNSIKKYDDSIKLKNYGSIEDIYVISDFRGKKVSSKLRDKAIYWFKKKSMKYVAISFNSENKIAHKIYKNWGFSDEYTEMWKKI
jgi:GNAT superfamily N-acetyltransferase